MATNSKVYRIVIIPNDFWQGDASMTPNYSLAQAERNYHADPNNEAAARALIQAYQQARRRDDALRVGVRLLLHLDTLNRLPEPETHRLMQSLAAVPSVSVAARLVSRRSLFAACAAIAVYSAGAFVLKLDRNVQKQGLDVQLEASEREANHLAENAFSLYQKGEYDTAYTQAQTARDKYLVIGAVAAEGKVCLTIGQIFQAWGKFPIAQYWINKGTAQIRQAGKPLEAAYALNLATNLEIKLGNFETAKQQNEQSLQIRRDTADEAGVIECLRERGTILAETEDYPAAETAWQDATRRARKANKPDMIASLEFLRGMYAIRQNTSDNGLLESSFRYWQQGSHLKWQADVRLRQAEGDIHKGQLDAAQAKLNFCRSIYKQKKSLLGLADCDVLEGQIALAQGETTLAQSKIGQAIAFYRETGLKPRLKRAMPLIITI